MSSVKAKRLSKSAQRQQSLEVSTRVLRLRIKDKHAALLRALAQCARSKVGPGGCQGWHSAIGAVNLAAQSILASSLRALEGKTNEGAANETFGASSAMTLW